MGEVLRGLKLGQGTELGWGLSQLLRAQKSYILRVELEAEV